MTERLYHEIMCPTLTKKGPCNCTPVIVADKPQRDARLAAILEARDKIVQAEREGSRGGWAWLAQPDDGPLPHGLPEYHAMLAGAYRTIDRLLDQLAALGADEEEK